MAMESIRGSWLILLQVNRFNAIYRRFRAATPRLCGLCDAVINAIRARVTVSMVRGRSWGEEG